MTCVLTAIFYCSIRFDSFTVEIIKKNCNHVEELEMYGDFHCIEIGHMHGQFRTWKMFTGKEFQTHSWFFNNDYQ